MEYVPSFTNGERASEKLNNAAMNRAMCSSWSGENEGASHGRVQVAQTPIIPDERLDCLFDNDAADASNATRTRTNSDNEKITSLTNAGGSNINVQRWFRVANYFILSYNTILQLL